jgi:uncharacterized protein YcaQ
VEPGAPAEAAQRIAQLLRETAAWQGLGDVVVADRGNLAPDLASAIKQHSVAIRGE